MRFPSVFRQAWTALLVNRGRSALTILGIVIGIGAVIAMVAAGNGAEWQLNGRINSVGSNVVLIRPGGRSEVGVITDKTPLTVKDADTVRADLGARLKGVAPIQGAPTVARYMGNRWAGGLIGTTPDWMVVGSWRLVQGRALVDADLKRLEAVCVIGDTVRQQLFPQTARPLGARVRAGPLELTVVGVLAPKGNSPTGVDQDNQIFLPLSTLQRRYAGTDELQLIMLSTRDAADLDWAKNTCRDIMRQRHRLKPGAPDDFEVVTVQEIAEIAVLFSTTMQVLIASIAGVSLVVGGIGIMNMMLVSVTMRTREIGLRQAVGARALDIMAQFMLEAVVMTVAGGVLGVVAGLGVAAWLAEVAGWPLLISPDSVLLAVLISAGIGLFFGFYPAWRASQLQPIEALRSE